MLRSISATAGAIAAAVLLHLAWFILPLESGLAIGHAILAALLATNVLGRAVRLESLNFHDPQPSHTTGPALLSAGILLAFDGAHAASIGVLAVDQLELTLIAGMLTAMLVHVACETIVAFRSRVDAEDSWQPVRSRPTPCARREHGSENC